MSELYKASFGALASTNVGLKFHNRNSLEAFWLNRGTIMVRPFVTQLNFIFDAHTLEMKKKTLTKKRNSEKMKEKWPLLIHKMSHQNVFQNVVSKCFIKISHSKISSKCLIKISHKISHQNNPS